MPGYSIVPHAKRQELKNGVPDDLSEGRRRTLAAAKVACTAGFVGDHCLENGTIADLVEDREHEEPERDARLAELIPLIEQLPARLRQVMLLRLGLPEGPCLSYGEIAEQLGCSVSSVYSAFSKGQKQLEGHFKSLTTSSAQEPPVIARANGTNTPSTNGTASADVGRCKACNRAFKNRTFKVCYNPECSEFRKGVQRKGKGAKAKAAKAATSQVTTKVAPPVTAAPKPTPPLAIQPEFSAMQMLADLPRAAALRVIAWASSFRRG